MTTLHNSKAFIMDDQFLECVRVFMAHDYKRAANLSLNLLEQRRFHWLYQVLLICVQRIGDERVVKEISTIAIDAFIKHEWETKLLRLTIEGLEINNISGLDIRAKRQLSFYLASWLLTQGKRTAARLLFEIAAFTQEQDAETVDVESVLAYGELECPEPRTFALRRVLMKCQETLETLDAIEYGVIEDRNTALGRVRQEMEMFLLNAAVAVDIFEETLSVVEPLREQQELMRLASEFGRSLQEVVMSQKEGRDLYDRLSCAPIVVGQEPVVLKRLPAGRPPLHSVRVTLKQLATDQFSELTKAALSFGFPLFLGRHPLTASPERPAHKLMRETLKDGREVNPFCRRRFSGDTSIPLPRARYHAVCDANTSHDGGTVIAEMMAYTVLPLTGYCATHESQFGVEVIFRGLPQEPNPFYLACRNPDKFEAVFQGLPSENPLRGLKTLPSAENILIVPMGTRITERQFERCLDLRMSDAREWLLRFFANPPDGGHGDALRVLAKTHKFKLHTISGWSDLLPVLIARTSGGNALTDMVGAYLRSLGCDALIFPSARNDFHATLNDGTLISSSGWNLVDYRGLDPVDRLGIDLGDPIEPLETRLEFNEATNGRSKGSIRLVGNRLSMRVMNQINHEYFISGHGPRWLVEHKQHTMFMRSYLWYRKRYPRPGFLCICDGCESSFTDESVAVLSQCPTCGFQGD